MSSAYPSPSPSHAESPSPRLGINSITSPFSTPGSPSSPYFNSPTSPGSPYFSSPGTNSFPLLPYENDLILFTPDLISPSSPQQQHLVAPTSHPRSTALTSSAIAMDQIPRSGSLRTKRRDRGSFEMERMEEGEEVWVTKDGREVRYSSMHMQCATM